jgi:hypothetical protein
VAVAIVSPCFGRVEFAIQQDVAMPAGIGQEHPDLAVLNAARRAAVLTADPGRMAAFFEELPGLG